MGLFTEEERAYLRTLDAVARVSETTITYTHAFRDECLRRYNEGASPTQLFREAGLDPKLVGAKRIERCFARWRKAEAKAGSPVRADIAEEHRALLARVKRLEDEAAVLRALVDEQGSLGPGGMRKTDRFALLERVRSQRPELSISASCRLLGVTEGGYNAWRHRQREA